MISVSEFLPRLMPHVIGCSEPQALQALVDSAIQFCERSLILTTTLDPDNIKTTQGVYDIDLPSGYAVAQVIKAWADGNQLTPAPTYQVDNLQTLPGNPRYFFTSLLDESYVINLFPIPDKDVANGLVLQVALKPTRNATRVSSVLFNDYADAIVDGAIGLICMLPGQSYSDPAKAAAYGALARMKAGMARADSVHGRAQSSVSVKMRPFA